MYQMYVYHLQLIWGELLKKQKRRMPPLAKNKFFVNVFKQVMS